MKFALAVCAAACALPVLVAQDRDFLTPNEVEQVRQAQDPNDRLVLYVHFAKQRMDLVEQYLAKEKPGRSIFIHDALDDYSNIIEAIDSVSDDALLHKHPMDKGIVAVLDAEKEFLAQLNKIQDSQPKDLDRYKFVLQQAIDTTSDSHEMSMEDSGKRAAEVQAEDAKETKEREAVMSSKEVNDRKKSAEAQEKPKKKIPTLYRPGEKPQQPQN
jgi:hypothetical protein